MATESSYLDNFIILKKIGKGATATVKSVQDPNTLQIYAAKILHNQSEHLTEHFRELMQNEIQSLSRINHPGVVNIITANENGVYTRKNNKGIYKCMYILMEFCPNGQLFDIIYQTGNLSDGIARFYFKQIIERLSACHNAGIAHRDLKPENILFDENFNLKISDFGFSALLAGRDRTGLMHTRLGTEKYMAPEILMNSSYHGESVDLFAVGVILFLIYTRSLPFGLAQRNDFYYNALISGNNSFWAQHSRGKPLGFFSADFKDLINKMLTLNPNERLSIKQIKSHNWYKGRIASPDEVIDEIKNRRKFILEKAEKAKEERKSNQSIIVNGGRLYRGDPSRSESLSLSFEIPIKEFKVQNLPSQGLINKYCSLLTGFTPKEIITILSNEFGKKDIKCETNDNSYDLKVSLDTITGPLIFKSSIYKTSDDLYILDFTFIEGNHLEMMSLFSEISECILNIEQEEY